MAASDVNSDATIRASFSGSANILKSNFNMLGVRIELRLLADDNCTGIIVEDDRNFNMNFQ
jgi:hypothetical protein